MVPTFLQVGNCVAKRNYRFFYLFLVTVAVMCLYVMGCNVAVVVVGKCSCTWTVSLGRQSGAFPSCVVQVWIVAIPVCNRWPSSLVCCTHVCKFVAPCNVVSRDRAPLMMALAN